MAVGLAVLAASKLRGIGIFRTIFTSTVAISVASASVIWALIYNPSLKMTTWLVDLLHLQTRGSAARPRHRAARGRFHDHLDQPRLQLHYRPGRPAGHTAGPVREQPHRRRKWLAVVPLYYPAAAHSYFAVPADYLNDQRLPGLHPVQCADRQRRPDGSTNVLVFALFSAFFKDNRYGFASAMAVVLFVVLLV